ncbi:MAG: class I SAM-dependent methyltransferase, partial [Gemmatimonadaceae bacterium]|nr:class I SAM-dependent methyltransferase [Gemmatimonadaceae bacterium]
MKPLRRIARALLYPVRRVLDPRFHDVTHRIALLREEVGSGVERVAGGIARTEVTQIEIRAATGEVALAQVETLAIVGQELRAATGEVAATNTAISDIGQHLATLRGEVMQLSLAEHESSYRSRMAQLLEDGRPSSLDQPSADLINFASSHRGFAAQAGLWLNPPVVVDHREGRVTLGAVNERIVEIPFAMRALGQVPLGSRILDFGSSESTVSLSLASLGYRVTALDLSRYPFTHPNLDVVQEPLEDATLEPDTYDAALLISTVEHVGLGWYGERPGAYDDRRALARIAEVVRPGGIVVVTVPYGTAEVTEVQRIYDAPGLDALLEGLEIVDRVIVEERDATWT